MTDTTLPTRTTLAEGAQAHAREQGWPPYRPTCSACGGGTHVAVGERCSLCQPEGPDGGAGLEALAVELARFCSCAGGAYGDNTEPDEVRPYLTRAAAHGAVEATARAEAAEREVEHWKGNGEKITALLSAECDAADRIKAERDAARTRADQAEAEVAELKKERGIKRCEAVQVDMNHSALVSRLAEVKQERDQAKAALARVTEAARALDHAIGQWKLCMPGSGGETRAMLAMLECRSALAAALEPTR